MKFKICGELYFKDYLRAALIVGKKFIILQGMVGIISVFLFIFPSTMSESRKWISLLFYPTIGSFIMFLVLYWRERRVFYSVDQRFHQKKIEMNEIEIISSSKASETHLLWSNVRKVIFHKKLIVIILKGGQYLLLPKHFFQSLEEEIDCISFIKCQL